MPYKNLVFAVIIGSSAHSNQSNIVFSSYSIEKRRNELFSKAPEQVVPLLIYIYSEEDIQQTIKIILKSQSSAIIALIFNKTCERPLKARTLDIYKGKFYIEYYNFC